MRSHKWFQERSSAAEGPGIYQWKSIARVICGILDLRGGQNMLFPAINLANEKAEAVGMPVVKLVGLGLAFFVLVFKSGFED